MIKKVLIALLAALLLAGSAVAEALAEAAENPTGEAPAEEAGTSPKPAKGYVLVSTATRSGWLPLPEEGEYAYHLKQVLSDGSEAENVIHLTPDGVYMEDSTCENHDCVGQGEVTLENRDERILGNMIICLPNQVYLQLFTPEEVLEMVQEEQKRDNPQ